MGLSERRAAPCRVFWFAAVLCAAAGCSDERGDLGAIRRAYAEGKYEEALSVCERSIREGSAGGDVYYYSGLSLLAVGRDEEALDRFGTALRTDSALAGGIAGALVERARGSAERGEVPRATLLARAALGIDRDAPIGPLKYAVASSYFSERNWSEAAVWYEAAIVERPDTTAAERGYFELSACRAAMGDTASALEALGTGLERFPRGEFSERAAWMLSGLRYERARSDFARGDYESAVRGAERVAAASSDKTVVGKALFLMGESYERMGDFERAYEIYEEIAENQADAPGGIAERARAKMRGIRGAGLR